MKDLGLLTVSFEMTSHAPTEVMAFNRDRTWFSQWLHEHSLLRSALEAAGWQHEDIACERQLPACSFLQIQLASLEFQLLVFQVHTAWASPSIHEHLSLLHDDVSNVMGSEFDKQKNE